jgi:hypothetical protein
VKVYEAFVEGAKEGFDVAKNLLPYLVAMLVPWACCALPAPWSWPGRYPPCGAVDGPGHPLRRGAADRDGQAVLWQRRAGDADRDHADPGVDSFPALVAATIQGSTETTFYVLAVYFGAVGIQRVRMRWVRTAGRVWPGCSRDRVLLVLRLTAWSEPS